jgi:hypothetical protein
MKGYAARAVLVPQASAVDSLEKPWKAVESQTDSQLAEQIKPKIAALAAKGRRSWEPIEIDFALLTSVRLVRNRLAGLDAAARDNPDAELDAIGGALEAAIQSLPNPYRSAALEHFGFTDQRPDKPLQGAREKRAAEKFGKGDGWYRKPNAKYFGMKPGEYVIALITCAFCGIANPIDYIARRECADAEAALSGPRADLDLPSDGIDATSTAGAADGEIASLGATMVSRDPDHLEVFWIGPNNEVFYRWWRKRHGWSVDDCWAEPTAVSLTAVSRKPGDEILFGLSPDGRVWYRVWEIDDRGWHVAGQAQWFEDAQIVRGPLASASRGHGTVELFAFDMSGTPWHRWTEDGMNWSPWTYW